ncbi:MAG TPA: hypothetical protein VKI62_05875, partial [Bacteroidota bacterium]|nr:hypothetical protein [Bacteroidota bacterium]
EGGEHEHVMTYNGFKNGEHWVAQAASNGFVETKLSDAIDPAYIFVDVTRYGVRKPNNILYLGEHYPIQPVQDQITALLAKGVGYPYLVLPFLAAICELRKIQGGSIWKNLIDEGFEWVLKQVDSIPTIAAINAVISKGEHPLDCSASRFQIFKNANYPFEILPGGMYDLYKDTTPSGESAILTAMNEAMSDQAGVVVDFVTPKDTFESPEEIFQGQLQFGNLQVA